MLPGHKVRGYEDGDRFALDFPRFAAMTLPLNDGPFNCNIRANRCYDDRARDLARVCTT